MPSRQEIVDDLKQVFADTGIRPTVSNYREEGRYSMTPIYSRFGSWDAAKEAAGVDRELENPRKISRERLLSDIGRVQSKVDGVVTEAEYETHGKYSISVLRRRFGAWTTARIAAGIAGNPKAHNRISESDAKQALKELSEELGRTPRRSDVKNSGEYSYAMYERKFGSWNDALIDAGFEVNQPSEADTTEVTCEQCGDLLVRDVADISGKDNVFCSEPCHWEYLRETTPSGEDHPQYNRVSRGCGYCGATVDVKPSVSSERERVFCDYACAGQWRSEYRSGENSPRWLGGDVELECELCETNFTVRRAKADSARFCSYECLGAHHREVRSGSDNPNWRGGYEPYYGPNWREKREQTLRRDGFQCTDCGLTQEESRNRHDEGLSIHHRIPFREFRENGTTDYESANHLENLVTLCRICHKKWEHMPVQYEVD